MSLLEIRGLELDFHVGREVVHVLRGVNMHIPSGARAAIVGESGSGKTVSALTVLRLLPATARIVRGEVLFEGTDLLTLPESEMRKIRGSRIAMVFQNPTASLNPLYPVGRQIADVYRTHFGGSPAQAWREAVEVLAATGIANPEERARDYPHQYSGGMAQRALIAMALVCKPRLLIADEPTSGLDVTIQTQVLDLIQEVVDQLGATLALITHDIAVVSAACDRVIVMYAGTVMESGSVDQVLQHAANPYTIELLKCFADAGGDRMPFIPGRVPDLRQRLTGCSFADRCPLAQAICREQTPPLIEVEPGHVSACHFANEL